MTTPQALESVRTLIIESGRDTRYRLGAYLFALSGLEYYIAKIGEKRHVSGRELAGGLAEFAVKQFGPLALNVLNSWGVSTTDDFGYIVYNLIDIGQMTRQSGDRLEEFFGVLDLNEYCGSHDPFTIDREHIGALRGV